MGAVRALPPPFPDAPGLRPITARAPKSLRPPELLQIRLTRLLGRESALEFGHISGILLHRLVRYILGLPESSKYLVPLFLGIRQGRLHLGLDRPDYIANLKRLADADCSLDVDTPRQGMTATEVLVKVLDKVPSLRLVMDHLPDVRFPDRAAKDTYMTYLRELGTRPQVYIKLSEVVHKWGDRVSTDVNVYRDWLDELWSIFGEDRVMFGSDWPQSESLEFNSYPNVFGVARAYVSSKGPSAMEKVFWKNSLKPYRWVQRLPSQRQA